MGIDMDLLAWSQPPGLLLHGRDDETGRSAWRMTSYEALPRTMDVTPGRP
jgi:hypothetical protein